MLIRIRSTRIWNLSFTIFNKNVNENLFFLIYFSSSSNQTNGNGTKGSFFLRKVGDKNMFLNRVFEIKIPVDVIYHLFIIRIHIRIVQSFLVVLLFFLLNIL